MIRVGTADYTVVLSRRLNHADQEDHAYLVGQPPVKSGQLYLGVFVRIDNRGDRSIKPARALRLVNADGESYRPLAADKSAFALRFDEPIPPGETAPPPDSPAASGTVHGSLVLFRLPDRSASKRPVELAIPKGNGRTAHIELDV